MGPQLTAGLVGLMNDRSDRPTFLSAVRVLSLAAPDSPGHQAVTPLWDEARSDPELAVILMESRYNWRGSARAGQILNELAQCENRRVALLAASQLWPLIDDSSISTLVRLLSHEDPRRVRAAAMALSGGGPARPDLVIPALEAVIAANKDPDAVETAKESLGTIKKHLRDLRK